LLCPLRHGFSAPQKFNESNNENYEIVNLEKKSIKKISYKKNEP